MPDTTSHAARGSVEAKQTLCDLALRDAVEAEEHLLGVGQIGRRRFRAAGLAAVPRAGIVHRLDKDTSGLMVVAKSESAAEMFVFANVTRCS